MAEGLRDRIASVEAGQEGRPRPGSGARMRLLRTVVGAHIPFGVALVLVAFILRVIAATILHYIVFPSGITLFTQGDDQAYDYVAWQQALVWHGVIPEVHQNFQYLLNVYTYTGAAVYMVVGHQVFAVILLNCFLGSIAAVAVYLTTRLLFGELAARIAGLGVAFFPTVFFWSLMNMKDAMFLSFVALLMLAFTALLQHFRWWLLIAVFVLIALIGGLRLYILGMLCLLVPGTILLQRRVVLPHKWSVLGVTILGCASLLWFSGGARWIISLVPGLNEQRVYVSQMANSGYVPTPVPAIPTIAPTRSANAPSGGGQSASPGNAANPAAQAGGSAVVPPPPLTPNDDSGLMGGATSHEMRSLLAWLPTGATYAIAAPFPWAATRTIERITIPEMLLWYVALALAVLGVAVQLPDWRRSIHVLGYDLGILLLFAIGQGNLGLLIRQRSMMLVPFVLIFSGAGAAWLWRRWRSRSEVPV